MRASLLRRTALALGPALALLLAAPASTGVVVTVEAMQPGAAKAEILTLSPEADRLCADGTQGAFICRTDRKLAQAQAQLAALPPDQRAIMEKMMATRMGGQVAPGMMGAPASQPQAAQPKTFVPTGKKETINDWDCSSHDAQTGGVTTEELWVTPFASSDATETDFTAVRALAEFASRLAGPLGRQLTDQPLFSAFTAARGPLPGVPVRSAKATGRGTHATEIKKVARVAVPADRSDLPQG